jgi:Tfp pilus assembly protein PilW
MKRTRITNQHGITLIEMMVSILASLLVVMSLGRVMTMNQNAWTSHRDKSDIQSNTASILDRMAMSVREASVIEVTSGNSFTLRDMSGAVSHTYAFDGSSILQDGVAMSSNGCTGFTVTADADATSLLLHLIMTTDDGSSTDSSTRISKRLVLASDLSTGSGGSGGSGGGGGGGGGGGNGNGNGGGNGGGNGRGGRH